jgi:hypothetical protein
MPHDTAPMCYSLWPTGAGIALIRVIPGSPPACGLGLAGGTEALRESQVASSPSSRLLAAPGAESPREWFTQAREETRAQANNTLQEEVPD